MNRLPTILVIISMVLQLTLASEKCGCETSPRCPQCNPKAGCRIWRCPCEHEGFIMHPGNEPLNAPIPAGCPKCLCSVCDNLAIRCSVPYRACDAEQVATYKCIEEIENTTGKDKTTYCRLPVTINVDEPAK